MPRKEEVSQPVNPEYPDKTFGEAVYRWTGNMVFTRQVVKSVIVPVAAGNNVKLQSVDQNEGAEEVPFSGGCLICGEPTFAWHSGPHHDEMLGNSLAVFAVSGKNEPPLVYCQKHDPGAEQRKRSGRLRPEEAEGAVVRVR